MAAGLGVRVAGVALATNRFRRGGTVGEPRSRRPVAWQRQMMVGTMLAEDGREICGGPSTRDLMGGLN